MTSRSFERAIEATDQYSNLTDEIEHKAESIVIVLSTSNVEYDRSLATVVGSKTFELLFNSNKKSQYHEQYLHVLALKLKKNCRQDLLIDYDPLMPWVRVLKQSITDIDDWLNNFNRFYKSVFAAWKVIH